MAAKKNKDGLIGGVLVSAKDHARVLREKTRAKIKAEQEAAEKAKNNETPE